MTSRMDRYNTEKSAVQSSRLSKNKKIYEDLYTNTSYTEFTDLDSSNVVDLNEEKTTVSRREQYQKTRGFSNVLSTPSIKTREYDIFKSTMFDGEPKTYDINSILADAKKNRAEPDELERKRKLRTTEYNILADLSQEKIKEHRERKNEVLTPDEEDELEELINTITSKTMRQELDQNLLGDLMPNTLDETVISDSLNQDIKEEINNSERIDVTGEVMKLDKSFFTKSMDLSDHDLISARYDNSFEDLSEKRNPAAKVIITIIVIILIAVIGYILYSVIGGK